MATAVPIATSSFARSGSRHLGSTGARWRADDRLLSLEETIEETERRRAAWPRTRLLDLLGPETRRISR